MAEVSRRVILAGAMAAPALVGSLRARAETHESAAERRLHEDWAYLGRYAEDNARLIAEGKPVSIVFMGDSITEGWRDKRPGFFTPGRVGRGIGGQTTPQMLVRMMPDVVALKPRAVHIMAGTNDIAGNTGPMTEEMTRNNIRAMTAVAKQHGIRVILASIPPAASFPWRPGLETVAPIRALNRWIKAFAEESGSLWLDYHPVLSDGQGGMRPGLAYDGVHPTEAGYDAMGAALAPVLSQLNV
ncbi:SGNH/GDSL hydrolase family protein [Pedomonas mirosovicensis]|uniref:SGNH/GDSL hydrolase family protein n=1 Tax=Pedomonas mirosovicensis TaxID=2908641 RepID=UPI002167494F|nr:SGNH/GDSL hydrolase family protein [Pedomonas mirosovicensis]MCH8686224.1 SGNH/GDSL hydrolase family protein [Pedomonas mirosovicensis]